MTAARFEGRDAAPVDRPLGAGARSKMRTEGLTVRYGDAVAVDDVSLEIPEHEVTAVIGPSGCGKSSLLRALNRMHDTVPNASVTGRVELDGEDIYAPEVDAVEVRRRVGMVFQRSNPFPKSVFDNVAFGLRVAGERDKAKIEQRVRTSLEDAALWDEVEGRLHESALDLSGGQQQRLCIARALAVSPDVLLMDEPASALDPIATAKIEELIERLVSAYTIVIVTHSMQQARRVSDHTAFLYLGALVEHGPTAQLFEDPREPRTRDYVMGRFG